jgi:hypothetical protein
MLVENKVVEKQLGRLEAQGLGYARDCFRLHGLVIPYIMLLEYGEPPRQEGLARIPLVHVKLLKTEPGEVPNP